MTTSARLHLFCVGLENHQMPTLLSAPCAENNARQFATACQALGVIFTPVWNLIVSGPIKLPYAIGLAIAASGGAVILGGMVREFRNKSRDVFSEFRLRLSLVVLSVVGLYLFAEVLATAVILVGGMNAELFNFRVSQRRIGTPIKVPHPFTLVVNNSEAETINTLGFLDREWPEKKPPGTIRFACIGASTSEDGYPLLP